MLPLIIGCLLVPAADQAIKRLVERRLRSGIAPDLQIGAVRVVESQIWLVRGKLVQHPAVLWTIWLTCAALLTALTLAVPACGAGAGLLLGGSASHALETSIRGRICDYICLPFWPAFNLADAAITVGAIGIAVSAAQFLAAA